MGHRKRKGERGICLTLALVVIVLSGCGGGGGGGVTTDPNSSTSTNGMTVSGGVSAPAGVSLGRTAGRAASAQGLVGKGGVSVEAYHIDDNGNKIGQTLSSGTANDKGWYTITFPAEVSFSSNLIVVVGTGTNRMRAVVTSSRTDLTPVTELVVAKLIDSGQGLLKFSVDEIKSIQSQCDADSAGVDLTDAQSVESSFTALYSGDLKANLDTGISLAAGSSENQVCGNGVLESGEVCDDGNTSAGDGCSALCRIETGLRNPDTFAAGYEHTCMLVSGTVKCWGSTGSASPETVEGVDSVIAFDAAQSHWCAIVSGGGVKCWGRNDHGELGNETTSHFTTEVADVSGISDAVDVAVGNQHSCAVLSTGGVKCWGWNGEGQLGNGAYTDSYIPVGVAGIDNAVAVSAGTYHSCALLSDGTAKCWGNNSWYQLGSGDSNDSSTPVAVKGLVGAIAISARNYHGCAIVAGGSIKCWGSNSKGQIGNGTTTSADEPALVSGITGAVDISTHYRHTCAVLSGGGVRCWGENDYGQLGNGTLIDASIPVEVSGVSDAVTVSAGQDHTCALLSGGGVKCWGANDYKQLGDGKDDYVLEPSEASGLTGVQKVAAGLFHACAIVTGEGVKCWGHNADGQLGDGTTIDSSVPVTVSGLSNAVDITTGAYHSCVILSSGVVKCWGSNSYGQLGNGSTTDSSTPVDVQGITDAVGIESKESHTCAVLSSGGVKCWGWNTYGQMGNGSTSEYSNIPVDVYDINSAVKIRSGRFNACAIMSDNSVSCWGDNESCQLGNYSCENAYYPVDLKLSVGAEILDLAPYNTRTCAVAQGLGVRCWGYGNSSLMRNESNETTVIAIDQDFSTTCFLTSGGTIQCWGDNRYGQCGNGVASLSNVNDPVKVSGVTDASAVSTGGLYACALLHSRKVKCWGSNTYGQIGDGRIIYSTEPVSVTGL